MIQASRNCHPTPQFLLLHCTMMEPDRFEAQALVWKHIYGFADSMVLKCALELGVFDILHHHGRPMTLPELASSLSFPSVNSDRLYRVMRYLAHMKLLHLAQDGPVTAYSLTPASKLLFRGEKRSLASFAMLQYYEMEAWHHLSAAVDGTAATPWEKCHGVDYRRYFAEDGRANQLLSDAMTSHTSMVTEALVQVCKTGGILEGVRSLVDVGGSTGVAAGAIAAAFPGIQCAVFDLPHVIATALEWPGVKRIAGDMFKQVPKADVIFMKSVLHDWGDDDCVKILKKCKEALPETGKVVVVDIVMEAESSSFEFAGARLGMEMDMLVTVGGKERSKDEWAALFKAAGYSSHKITPMAAIESIIEAFP